MASRGRGHPEIGPLYARMTTPTGELPGALDIFGKLSLTSQFKVSLHLTNNDVNLMGWLKTAGITDNLQVSKLFDFYCAETSLPGATFDVTEEIGSRQGVIERFPTKRVYPDVTMTFYVDYDYKLIRLFEEWMNYINPVYTDDGEFPPDPRGQGDAKNRPDFFRLRYPDSYKRIISIVKFERDFNTENVNRPGGIIYDVPTITYRLIDAFPTNIAAMPVTYEGSTITKTIVTFSYSRYVIEKHKART
jgi:hypothetical protein